MQNIRTKEIKVVIIIIKQAIDRAATCDQSLIPASAELQKIRNVLEGSDNENIRNEMSVYLPNYNGDELSFDQKSSTTLQYPNFGFISDGSLTFPPTPPLSVSPPMHVRFIYVYLYKIKVSSFWREFMLV